MVLILVLLQTVSIPKLLVTDFTLEIVFVGVCGQMFQHPVLAGKATRAVLARVAVLPLV